MKVEFIKDFSKRKKGDVVDPGPYAASLLIQQGVAKKTDAPVNVFPKAVEEQVEGNESEQSETPQPSSKKSKK